MRFAEAFAGSAIAERGMLVVVPLPDDGGPVASGKEGMADSVMSQKLSKFEEIGRFGVLSIEY